MKKWESEKGVACPVHLRGPPASQCGVPHPGRLTLSARTPGLETVYPLETEINLKARYLGRDQKEISWQPLDEPSGRILLNEVVPPKDDCVVYGACIVEPPEEARYTMLLCVKVWINGKEVWKHAQERSLKLDSDRVEVALHKGPNQLLLKVEQGMGDVGWAVRFLDSEDRFQYSLLK